MRKGRVYKRHKATRKTQRERILILISEKEIDTISVAKKMKLTNQIASARLSELEQLGLIYQKAKHRDDGRVCTIWKTTPSELVELRRNENWNKRFAIWISKGLKNGFISNKELRYIERTGKLF